MSNRVVTYPELAKHNSKSDCWVAIHGKVYDLTAFLSDHPGGASIIAKEAGRDGSKSFAAIHPSDLIQRLGYEKKFLIGKYDASSAPKAAPATAAPKESSAAAAAANAKTAALTPAAASTAVEVYTRPPMDAMMNVFDMEAVAFNVMKKEAWDYYSSGAEDEITLRENHSVFHRVWLRPRILVNVKTIHTATTLLGYPSAFPLYISATALARLAHDDGECALVRAARKKGIIYMLPTLSSCSLDEMLESAVLAPPLTAATATAAAPAAAVDSKTQTQTVFTQLYVNSNRAATEDYVRRAEAGGCRALFVTVDAPQLGRREKDMRNKFSARAADVQQSDDAKGLVNRSQGTAKAISAFIDPSLSWTDLEWLRSFTKLPIVLKGVQCAEDVLLAVEYGCAGVVLSNHGGRQLDFSRSGLEVLVEVMRALKRKGWENRIEVYIDGGIRRGSDIFKALALGARAVGVGRPVLYGLASFGQSGVERVLDMLRDEFETVMRMSGTPSIAHIKPDMCIVRNISDHFAAQPKDHLSVDTYKPLYALSKL